MQNPETPAVVPADGAPEFESIFVSDRATAEALGADFEDDTQTEADHG
ncbi:MULTISPECIES: hypothetical protein [unclassified Thiomonas]|jgi:hypothetical protein|nr:MULTISPECIES: hypothetical protein [unclassified Thiomonas]CDW96367.1 putative Peptidase S9 prolyl oligopeptidase active site domain protein [Thiomonas sp. CB2]VDY06708.1 Peptidase S9 prolyl oligopeptidase active site domain protein [Thiomonas sp. Bio17B3]VDY09998.1 Peptidase S9 prolyl oligopeptidase active site domain protein [Thiomonas sp. Sup16B3]VDY11221.1 Peptidase S9 prolyl oligopeptidase active site domain protein [Thiomonas sp. Bio17B3]VDY14982.1 putative Peptidase S9 prolyl oligope